MGGLFERVKETVAERILVKSWLDEETRTQALLKLNSLRGRFHVWPGFHNESLLAREMAEVRPSSCFFACDAHVFLAILPSAIRDCHLSLPVGGDRSGGFLPHRVETISTGSHRGRQGFAQERHRKVSIFLLRTS